MKSIIWCDLQNKYGEEEDFYNLSLASFVDPWLKHRHLEKKEETIKVVKNECMKFYSPACSPTQEPEPPPSKKLKGLAGLLAGIEKDHPNA